MLIMRAWFFWPLIVIAAAKIADFEMENLQNMYNAKYPSQFHNTPVQPHHFIKRCAALDPAQVVDNYVKGIWTNVTKGNPILVSSSCLGSDSLGNYLGSYFENIACAHHMGMHFVAVAKVYEPTMKDVPTPFLHALPTLIEHASPATDAKSLASKIKGVCKCPSNCHERSYAMWITEVAFIKHIFVKALQSHMLQKATQTLTIVSSDDLSSEPVGTKLPLIPEAAVHYRCGDNFVGHYGFLPFKALVGRIPKTAKTIYIMAENRNRKTATKKHLARRCDAVFASLFTFLKTNFPSSQILIQRGGDMYIDMARLTFAPVTVCSVSTFCLWPAIGNNGTAYFPKTKLIAGGDTSINLGFQWITTPITVLGQRYATTGTDSTLATLLSK